MKTKLTRKEAMFRNEIARLLRALKSDIGDEYRADEESETPSMLVTIGATVSDDGCISWSYQTGDNSFTGGAYGHANWGVVTLQRRSNCRELAAGVVEEILDSVAL